MISPISQSGFSFQSTHPTRGCDDSGATGRLYIIDFNPRTPRGGATVSGSRSQYLVYISIHAPHEGVRLVHAQAWAFRFNFNPRTPRGGATANQLCFHKLIKFQSTHPTRGCDVYLRSSRYSHILFQSTHPTRGCDMSE